MSEQDVIAIVAYIKSLSPVPPPVAAQSQPIPSSP